MNTKNSLVEARTKAGLTQEEVAKKLGTDRETILKWELGESNPNKTQLKELLNLYNLCQSKINNANINLSEIKEIIKNSNKEIDSKINWTKAWSKKYPILKTYQEKVDVKEYATKIRTLLEKLKIEYNYSELDAMLVLKDILYHEWKDKK